MKEETKNTIKLIGLSIAFVILVILTLYVKDKFYPEDTAPVVQFTMAGQDFYVNSTSILLEFSAYDDRSEILEYRLLINGLENSSGTINNGTTKKLAVLLPYKQFVNIELQVIDEVGNIGNTQATIWIGDINEPMILIMSIIEYKEYDWILQNRVNITLPINIVADISECKSFCDNEFFINVCYTYDWFYYNKTCNCSLSYCKPIGS